MSLSTFLDGQQPTRLRGLLWLALSETGNVLTLTSTSDSGGGASQSWTAGGAVPCRIDPLTQRSVSRLTGGAVDERSTHLVTVPGTVTATVTSRFAITGRGTFEITAAHEETGAQSRVFEVIEI